MRVWLTIGSLLTLAGPALAAPIDFECDVPPNRASSVDQSLPGPAVSMTGTLSIILARAGRFPASAGARLSSADGSTTLTLQLVGSGEAKDGTFAVTLTAKTPTATTRTPLGTLPAGAANIPFTLTVDATGAATATLAGWIHKAMLHPLTAPRARLFCSTGQFAFKGVEAR